MSLTAAAVHGFVVGLLSLSVVHGQDDWGVMGVTQFCAVEGGTVDFSCTYRDPHRANHQTTQVHKQLWLIKEDNNTPVDLTTDSSYTNRLWDYCDVLGCILRISNLTKSDSGLYKFKFETIPPCLGAIKMFVTDLRVEVINSLGSNYIRLQCQNSCPPHLVYVWYNNEQVMTRETSSSTFVVFQSRDRFSCAVSGFNHILSPSVYAPKPPVVSVSPSGEITEGGSVTLTCSSEANPAAVYSWYKRGQPYSGNISHGVQLVFRAIRPSDSGEYYCKADNKLGSKLSEYTLVDVKLSPGKYIAAGVITAVLLTVAFIIVFLWIRKKRALKESLEHEETPDNMGQGLPDVAQPEEQLNLHYANIHFINNQTDCLYSNIGAHHAHRHMEDKGATEYSVLQLKSAAPRNASQDSRADSSELYSTVNKT